MKKKGFTILELVMVIGIIMVLIFTFRNIFNNTNKDYLYAEVCVNKIYGDINNYIYSAMTSKGLRNSSGIVFPEQYMISIKPSNNEINLWYKEKDTTTGSYIINILNSEKLKESNCSDNKYTTNLSGQDFEVLINKKSIQDQTFPTFSINNEQGATTKTTIIELCYTGNRCKEIASFVTDIRTQSIKKKRCLLINDEDTPCLERDQ